MNRRGFLLALAAGTAAGLTGCARSRPRLGPPSHPLTGADPVPPVHPADADSGPATGPAGTLPPLPSGPATRIRSLPDTVISGLPGTGHDLALTVDDGTSSEVVGAYLEFAKATGARLTFFPNGINRSWTDHAADLRPLVESGQVQLGNHTWSHPDLRTLSDKAIAAEIEDNDRFLRNTYGVSGRPFLRPPYGSHNQRTDRIAADHGYWVITMWMGSLGDSSVLTPAQVLANARQWFAAQRIIIGHANHPAVTRVYGQLAELIRERNLHLVTLNDVFSTL